MSLVLLSCGNKVFNELIYSRAKKFYQDHNSKDDDGEDQQIFQNPESAPLRERRHEKVSPFRRVVEDS